MEARIVHKALLAVLVAGLAFSLYALAEDLNASYANVCSINSYVSCGKVLASGDTTFPPGSGVPDWSWGVGGFVALLLLESVAFVTFGYRWLLAVLGLAAAGVALAAVFAYEELVVIRALCPVCLGAYVCGVAALVLAAGLVRKRRRALSESEGDSPASDPP